MSYNPTPAGSIGAVGLLFTQTVDKTVANTTTETSGIGTGIGSLTVPANFLTVGKSIRIQGRGVYTVSAVGGFATITAKVGDSRIAAVQTSALLTTGSNNAFEFNSNIVCRSTGSSGTVVSSGSANYKVTGARTFDDLDNAGATALVDTTVANTLDITVQWNGSIDRSVVITQATVEALN